MIPYSSLVCSNSTETRYKLLYDGQAPSSPGVLRSPSATRLYDDFIKLNDRSVRERAKILSRFHGLIHLLVSVLLNESICLFVCFDQRKDLI